MVMINKTYFGEHFAFLPLAETLAQVEFVFSSKYNVFPIKFMAELLLETGAAFQRRLD